MTTINVFGLYLGIPEKELTIKEAYIIQAALIKRSKQPGIAIDRAYDRLVAAEIQTRINEANEAKEN